MQRKMKGGHGVPVPDPQRSEPGMVESLTPLGIGDFTETGNQSIASAPAPTDGFTSAVLALWLGTSHRESAFMVRETDSFTMRRCSSVMKTDQLRLLSSIPRMRLIRTGVRPAASSRGPTRSRIASRSRRIVSSIVSGVFRFRKRPKRIRARKSSTTGSPAPGASSEGWF